MAVPIEPLRESDVEPDPMRQFQAWFERAADVGVRAPEAAALATASADGQPSVRMVLVKRAGEDGFVFYSNYNSRKGRELSENPRASLLFYWEILGRQVRVQGAVRRCSAEESAAYARTRPRASQLSALASPQSQPIADRDWLERRVNELAASHPGRELPVSEHWGGYRLVPTALEFWQQRADRLHDRLLYSLRREAVGADPGAGAAGWRIQRLAP